MVYGYQSISLFILIQFLIRIKPKPQQRHRNNGRFQYDPSKSDKKDFILLSKQYAPPKPITDIVEIDITFCYKRPASHFRTKNKEKILKDSLPFFKVGRPDVDNLAKFYLDAMQGIFYKDDSQVVSLHGRKVYGKEDYVMVKIIPSKNFTKFA